WKFAPARKDGVPGRYAVTMELTFQLGEGKQPPAAEATPPPSPVAGGPGELVRTDPQITQPTVKKQVKPNYTRDAMDAHIEGVVLLQVVIGSDGLVKDVRVIKSLDARFGLDQEAVKAAKQWEFT